MNIGITPDKVFPAADGTRTRRRLSARLDSYGRSRRGAAGQIWIDAVGQTGGLIILLLVIGAQFYCGMSSVTANSRMIYAFSRDGAIPGSEFWHRINPRTRTPTNSIWLAAVGAFILGLPYLFSPVAYAAVTSIAVIGLYVAYITPGLPPAPGRRAFQEGPWTLGRWSRPDRDRRDDLGHLHRDPVHAAAGPADHASAPSTTRRSCSSSSSAAPALWWAVSAKNWFKGPKVQGTAEELAAIERDLELAVDLIERLRGTTNARPPAGRSDSACPPRPADQ